MPTTPPNARSAARSAARSVARSRALCATRVAALAVLLPCGLASAAGCYRATRGVDLAETPVTTVRVQNQNFLDMTVYVLREGARQRLGLATGLATSRFTIPAGLVQTLTTVRFVADPVGARARSVSEEVTVAPGDEVTITLPPG